MPGVASGTSGKLTRTCETWVAASAVGSNWTFGIDPLAQLGELDAGGRHAAHVLQLVLRNARRDAQAARLVDGEQCRPGHRHVAEFGVAAGDEAGHRRDDAGVALAGPGRGAIGGGSIEIGLGLVKRGGAHELLGDQAFRPLVGHLGVSVLGLGRARRLGRLAGVDAHQQLALFDRLPGISLHFQHPAGNLGADRRLLHRLDQRLGWKSQIDGVRLDHDDRQRLTGKCYGHPEKKPKNEKAENVCAHIYKHTLIYRGCTRYLLGGFQQKERAPPGALELHHPRRTSDYSPTCQTLRQRVSRIHQLDSAPSSAHRATAPTPQRHAAAS
jgi:hypothetical protein